MPISEVLVVCQPNAMPTCPQLWHLVTIHNERGTIADPEKAGTPPHLLRAVSIHVEQMASSTHLRLCTLPAAG